MNDKKIVFVSVPMNGKEEEEILRQIQITEQKYLNLIGCTLDDVYFYDNHHACRNLEIHEPNAGLRYLGIAIGMLANCDAAIFGKGWTKARGCRIEHMCCEEYGIPTIQFNEDALNYKNTGNIVTKKSLSYIVKT